MKNVIRFNGKLYAPLEEGSHTIQGEVIEVSERQDRKRVEALESLFTAVKYSLPQCEMCGGSGYVITADDKGRAETYSCTCLPIVQALEALGKSESSTKDGGKG